MKANSQGATDRAAGVLVLAALMLCAGCQGRRPGRRNVKLAELEPAITTAGGEYRWLDIADRSYLGSYRSSFTYERSKVLVRYGPSGLEFGGRLSADHLKPNFAYQIKLVGTPGTTGNRNLGLAGRWWQEEWDGREWGGGHNLNDKGTGRGPSPNDKAYRTSCTVADRSSPTGRRYRHTGYLPLALFVTDSSGSAEVDFQADSSYHVWWKTPQREWTGHDSMPETFRVDVDPRIDRAYGEEHGAASAEIYGEWERLPLGQLRLPTGEYRCRFMLTEESFHGSGGAPAGNWAAAVGGDIRFTIEAMSAPGD